MNKSDVECKREIISACYDLIQRYESPKGKMLFFNRTCSLCHVVSGNILTMMCRGCPLANKSGVVGCIGFATYKAASNSYRNVLSNVGLSKCYPNNKPTKEFIARANFFRKIIPILEKIPAKRFTPSGWEYFVELDREW